MSDGLRPAAIDDGQRVEQFGFPIGRRRGSPQASAASAGNHRPHVFRIDDDVAERRLHAPQPEQDVAVDAVVFFDARQQVGIFLGALFAGDDAPVRAAAVDVLPDTSVNSGCALVARTRWCRASLRSSRGHRSPPKCRARARARENWRPSGRKRAIARRAECRRSERLAVKRGSAQQDAGG